MNTITYKLENSVGYITLNKPDKANAMIAEMKIELAEILRQIRSDNKVRSVVITGKGKAFCAGGDLSTMGEAQTIVAGRERMKTSADWLKELAGLEKPTIASVNGAAFGSGLSLALACDFIIASQAAKLSSSFVKVGLVADMGALYFLPRRVGLAKAKQLIFTGDVVDPIEGKDMGLVDMVVSPEELEEKTKEFAEKLAKGATYAIGMDKKILNQCYETNLTTLLDMEATFQAVAFQTSDHKDAVKAFFEKSRPVFSGQ